MKLGSLGHNPLKYYTYLSSPWPRAIIPMRVMGSCPSLEISFWPLGTLEVQFSHDPFCHG
jgi:hypothetical protein